MNLRESSLSLYGNRYDTTHDSDFPTLSSNELAYAKKLFRNLPTLKSFGPDDYIRYPVLKLKNEAIIIGKSMGHGYFGEVHFASRYPLTSDSLLTDGSKCIVKQIWKTPFKAIFYTAQHTTMRKCAIKETELIQKFYGYGALIAERKNRKLMLNIVMPFLGELTLEELMHNKKLMRTIPCREWVNLFINFCKTLKEFHQMNFIHNDIKPANLVVSMQRNGSGLWSFTNFNLLDFGNAHKNHTKGPCGSLFYQPCYSVFGFFTGKVKTNHIDYFGMAKIFLEILGFLKKQLIKKGDKEVYIKCIKLFKKMQHDSDLNIDMIIDSLGSFNSISDTSEDHFDPKRSPSLSTIK